MEVNFILFTDIISISYNYETVYWAAINTTDGTFYTIHTIDFVQNGIAGIFMK